METKKHGVPFELQLDIWNSGNTQYVVKSESVPYVLATSYKSHNDAMKGFDRKVLEFARDGAKQYHNCQQVHMTCNDGTVLIGQWRYSNWYYSIGHMDTKGMAGSCSSSFKSFDELCEYMRKHATDSYHGVKHEFNF